MAPEISLRIFSGEKPPPRGIQDVHLGAALPSPEVREAEQLISKALLRPVPLRGRVGLLGEETERKGQGGERWSGSREKRGGAERKGELERQSRWLVMDGEGGLERIRATSESTEELAIRLFGREAHGPTLQSCISAQTLSVLRPLIISLLLFLCEQ